MKQSTLDKFRTIHPPVVIQVLPASDYQIYVYFSDGTIHFADIKPLIKPDTVFARLKDADFFKTRATVLNRTLAWDVTGDFNPEKCIDVAPEYLYDFPDVDDPLESAESSLEESEDEKPRYDDVMVFLPSDKVAQVKKRGLNIRSFLIRALDAQLAEMEK